MRTGTGTFFHRGHDDVITVIEKRVAAVTMISVGETGMPMCEADEGQGRT